MSAAEKRPKKAGQTATVAGLGTIGSQAAQSLARIPAVGGLNLVDPDIFELKNLGTQAISGDAVGRPKVEVVAEQLGRIRPDLVVHAYQARLEWVPWARLRADLFLGCLDTKAARRDLNRTARRLGGGLVDAGVSGPELLARARVFPAAGETCLECGWSRADYARLEVAHPCQGGEVRGQDTNSPAYLGGLAAALQVMECHRLLQREDGAATEAFELLVDGRNRKFFHSGFRPNPACRFVHGAARTEILASRPEEVSLAALLPAGSALEAEGDVFVRDLVCAVCRTRRTALLRGRALRLQKPVCETCGEPVQPLGFTMQERLEAAALERDERELSLAQAGFLAGDIFRIFHAPDLTTAPEVRYYELLWEAQP